MYLLETPSKVCVIYRGQTLVDLCAGTQGPVDPRPVRPTTLFCAFSAGKAVCSTAVHLLADRGLLRYDQRLSELWPEFACNGKETTTVSSGGALRRTVSSRPWLMPYSCARCCGFAAAGLGFLLLSLSKDRRAMGTYAKTCMSCGCAAVLFLSKRQLGRSTRSAHPCRSVDGLHYMPHALWSPLGFRPCAFINLRNQPNPNHDDIRFRFVFSPGAPCAYALDRTAAHIPGQGYLRQIL